MLDQIEYVMKEYGVEYIIFVDDTFTVNKERTTEICQGIIDRQLKIDWYCFSRVNTINEEMLKLMRRAGCFSILYGIESGNQDILNNFKKGTTLDQIRWAVQRSNELGFKTIASFILGAPGETKQTVEQTIDFAKEVNPTIASFNRLIPFPGTEVYTTHYKHLDNATNWDDFVPKGVVPMADICDVSSQELQDYTNSAFKQFYFRPKKVFEMISRIKTWGEFKAYSRGLYGLIRRMFEWKQEIKKCN